ncbi:MAG TPA: hypothetical protein VG273_22835 [Bryobacteraceae bacterium]|jgi:hypothetical protein|nr:hypothetical protein [Bryobacteraceae bacterium]
MKQATRANHATSHQLALKAQNKLSDREFAEMMDMLEELTPAERRGLENPDFITEDEADMIVIHRREARDKGRPSIPAAEVLKEFGLAPGRKRRA